MTELYQKLLGILQEHTSNHTQLLRLENEKREAIINNNTKEIVQLDNSEADILKSVAKAESERTFLVQSIAHELGFSGEIKLEILTKAMPKEQGTIISKL